MSITKILLLTSCGLILSGCAMADSIYRKNTRNPNGQSEFVDAKQRAVISNRIDWQQTNPGEDPKPYAHQRVCSEPAPDVFSVYALALTGSLSGNLGAGVDAGKQLEALATMSSGEAGATIERTQTINLMRESMFRTCERYMNGAIDKNTMQIQAARDQRAMVAVLAIEQLTGVVKRKPTIISATAQAQLSQTNQDLFKKYDVADKAKVKADDELKTATSAHTASKATYGKLNETKTGQTEAQCVLLAKETDEASGGTPAPTTTTGGTTSGGTTTGGTTTGGTTTNGTVQGGTTTGATTTGGTTSGGTTTGGTTVGGVTTGGTTVGGTTSGGSTSGGTTVGGVSTGGATTGGTTTGGTLAGGVTTGGTTTTTDAQAVTLAQCKAAEADVTVKKLTLDEKTTQAADAKKRYDDLLELLKLFSPDFQSTQTSAGGSGDEGSGVASYASISQVAKTVGYITELAFDTRTEFVYNCNKLLDKIAADDTPNATQNKIVDKCLTILETQAKYSAQTYDNASTNYRNVDEILRLLAPEETGATIDRSQTIWELREAAKNKDQKLQEIINNWPVCMQKAATLIKRSELINFVSNGGLLSSKLKRKLERDGIASQEATAVLEVCQ